jgi:hypothetical protein
MGAEFFSTVPATEQDTDLARGPHQPRLRRVHRALALIFLAAVAANFIAMAASYQSALITYAPLPPLFLLSATGVTIMIGQWVRGRRVRQGH